ncbi:peptidase T [Bacteroidota bacterium]
MENLVNRFIRYTSFDTQSDPKNKNCPSTEKQIDFAFHLFQELIELGLIDTKVDSNGYITASLPSNTDKDVPVIGFIAHMDTSPDMKGKKVKAQITKNYDGKDIVLNKKKNIILSPDDFPELKKYVGQNIISTDGTTLLGADNKAGIAEIISAISYLTEHPEIKHGTIKIAFTPDEEIGRGADKFDVKNFGAHFAYTIDGGEIGELECENFNAAHAEIIINGLNVHPGTAKNKMVNAILLAMEINSCLPPGEIPGKTENREGFFHLISIKGNVEKARLEYIIRDHDIKIFLKRKALLNNICNDIKNKYPKAGIEIEIRDQYFNMKEKIDPVSFIVDIAEQAMIDCGITPIKKAIRGGTDGSKLSFMGLPTPNIFTGGHNFHGRYEFIPVQSMEKAVEVIITIIRLFEKRETIK